MHASAVTGVDCAVRRPLAATVGADHAIRLWNHADRCAFSAVGHRASALHITIQEWGRVSMRVSCTLAAAHMAMSAGWRADQLMRLMHCDIVAGLRSLRKAQSMQDAGAGGRQLCGGAALRGGAPCSGPPARGLPGQAAAVHRAGGRTEVSTIEAP